MCVVLLQGETKADDSSNKEASEEKQEEDNDYHRSDEQVGGRRELPALMEWTSPGPSSLGCVLA